MKYIKTYESKIDWNQVLEKKDFDPDKLYLYQYKEWEEDDNYNFIVGLILKQIDGGLISGYHIHDEDEGEEEAKYIRGNWFPGVYKANEEEIKKYEMYKNVKNYNV